MVNTSTISVTEVDGINEHGTLLPDDGKCTMCGTGIGLITGDAEIPTRHQTYWDVQITDWQGQHGGGDTDPTPFCEDCLSWLCDIAPGLAAWAAAQQPQA
jgi:hypothetical protein